MKERLEHLFVVAKPLLNPKNAKPPVPVTDKDYMNPKQQEAVSHFEGPLLVLAGAGSGKTRVVTYRIVHLVEQGVPASAILGLTFTNKAAAEMKERVKQLTHRHILICTFHSLGARLLREYIGYMGYKRDFVIYDSDDSEKLLKTCLQQEGSAKELKGALKEIKTLISRAKNALQGPSEVDTNELFTPTERLFPKIYAEYQQKLRECQAVDFDDLLYLPVKLMQEHPNVCEILQKRWSFLLVDEFQDTNKAQYTLITSISGKDRNLCVVGDPDQSIYSWRGANINNILNFQRDFSDSKAIRLEQNYRSTNCILGASNALIAHNNNRIEKELWSNLGEGEKIHVCGCGDERQEASFIVEQVQQKKQAGIPYGEMVVFYRTNFQSRVFEDELLKRKVPYIIVGGLSFYQRKEIKDILAFLRMVQSGSDYVSFARTINLPKRGIGDKSTEKIFLLASTANMPLLDYCKHLLSEQKTEFRVTQTQLQGLKNYLEIIQSLKEISEKKSLKELVESTIDRTGYLSVLEEDPESLEDRKNNLSELVAKAAEWDFREDNQKLASFLEELSLKSNLDEAENATDHLNLMTLHNGKGLEFEVVFLAGAEEGLFPHSNAIGDEEAIEEERRLCYVGMTRAKKLLYITYSGYRFLWGSSRSMSRSRFLNEIPVEYTKKVMASYSSFRPSKGTEKSKSLENEFVDYPDEEAMIKGDIVFHKEFGVGTLLRAYTGTLGLTYEIQFSKDNSTRSIVAKYARLRKIS